MEVKQLLQQELKRLNPHDTIQGPNYGYIWTGSVKSNISSVRNEFGETFMLQDFIRNRSRPEHFIDTYFEQELFPSVQFSKQFYNRVHHMIYAQSHDHTV